MRPRPPLTNSAKQQSTCWIRRSGTFTYSSASKHGRAAQHGAATPTSARCARDHPTQTVRSNKVRTGFGAQARLRTLAAGRCRRAHAQPGSPPTHRRWARCAHRKAAQLHGRPSCSAAAVRLLLFCCCVAGLLLRCWLRCCCRGVVQLPCYCRAGAVLLPCCYRAAAGLPPWCCCRAAAVLAVLLRATAAVLVPCCQCRGAAVMLPCCCHVATALLKCC